MREFEVEMQLLSGFTIKVSPLTPYYLDFLDIVYPFKEHPKRQIKLAAGDVYETPFEPDENTSYTPDHEDYEYYIKYIATDAYNADLEVTRARVREDYLLSTCVSVVDGPYDHTDANWKSRMEAAFDELNWRVPKHDGALRLIFIKSIMRTQEERATVLDTALLREVSEQELSFALNMFPGKV